MSNWSVFISIVLVFVLQLSIVSHGVTGDGSVQKKAVVESHGTGTDVDSKTLSSTPVIKTTPKPQSSDNNTCANGTDCTNQENGYFNNILDQMAKNKGMLLRTMYVLIGVTGIVVGYFVIRAWRLKSRRRKARKYGIITTPASDLEMAPLGQGDDDDDDEDMTVFEMNGKRMK